MGSELDGLIVAVNRFVMKGNVDTQSEKPFGFKGGSNLSTEIIKASVNELGPEGAMLESGKAEL